MIRPPLRAANGSLVHLRAGTARHKRRGTLLAATNEKLGGSNCKQRDAVAHATIGGSAAGPTYAGASGATRSWAAVLGITRSDARTLRAFRSRTTEYRAEN